MGFLGIRFEVERMGAGVKLFPPFAQKYVVLENLPFSTKALLILLMLAFLFLQKSAFFDRNSPFTQSNSVRAVLEIF